MSKAILSSPDQKKIICGITLIIFIFGLSKNPVTWNNERPENKLQTIPSLLQLTDLNLLNNNSVLFKPQEIISVSHENIWPISGNATSDLPQSSPFGPRQQASEGYRYDFHRGIDIPADYGTPIHAIADGYVRLVSINDTYEQRDDGSIVNIYSSTVIQLKHNVSNWPDTYYSTYLHVNGTQTQVSAGSFVSKGEVIGFVGDDSTSDFAHLHFEIRYDGLYQYHNVNPWEFLPYINTANHEVELLDIAEVNSTYSNITVQLKAQANELDIDKIEITLYNIDHTLLENRSLSFNKINRNVTENYIEILDNNTISKENYLIKVSPSKFNGLSLTVHWNYTFIDVPVSGDTHSILIRGLDVQGVESSVSFNLDTSNLEITNSPLDFAIGDWYNTTQPLFWTATDSNPDTYTISLTGTGIVENSTTWISGEAIAYFIPPGFAVGDYIYTVNFTDDSGNFVTDSVTFTVEDATYPIIQSLPSDFTVEYGYSNQNLSWTATDSYSDTYTISLTGTGIVKNSTTWTSGEAIVYIIPPGFAVGDYIYTVTFTDDGSNYVTDSVTLTVEDTTPPAITITSPTATVYTTDKIAISLYGDAVNYWYYIQGDSYNQTWTTNVDRTLSDGTFTLHVYGNDSVGNVAHTSVIFTIDTPSTTTKQPLTTTTTTRPSTNTTSTTVSSSDSSTTTPLSGPGFNGFVILLSMLSYLIIRRRKN